MARPAPDTRLQILAREIFQAALDLDGEEREAYVSRRCAEDARLRAEVDSLLAALERSGGFLEGSVVDAAGAFWVGKRVGDYEILRLIGRGGVGLVFEARQDRPRRIVALKLLRPEFASDEVRRRFDVEAELLALLEHPGIARIYAAGTVDTQLGPQSFLAMELVEGRTLLDYAADEELSARERVRLVAAVCEAMQHAHERGVIHRDLKPGNVLVDGAGRTKVLDFGVARATNADLDVETLCTHAGAVVGTLAYMSPEQANGDSERLDARTDVYSLGAVLYQLLAGRLPLPVSELPLAEAVRTLSEDEPPPLERVAPDVDGDLATVISKALERDPERRYRSAGELGDDLARWLAREPVRARPPSTLYRLRKLAARNRGLVAGVVGFVGVLAVVAVLATVGALREQALRLRSERAEQEARTAQRKSERDAYAASMAVVERAIGDADVVEARALLDAAPASLRGWEWRHLASRIDRAATVLANGTGIESMRLFPDGRTLVTGGTDRVVRAWSVATGELSWEADLGDSYTVRALAVSPDGDLVAATRGSWFAGRGKFGPITLLAAGDGRVVAELGGHDDVVQALAFHPTAPRLFSASSDGTVRAFDLEELREERVLARHERDAQDVAVSPAGDLVASVGWDGRIHVADARDLAPVRTIEVGERLSAVAWSADARELVVGTWEGRVFVVDQATGAQRVLDGRHEGRVEQVRFAPGGDAVVSAGAESTILRHELRRGTRTDSFLGSTDVVTAFAFEPERETLLSGGLDGVVRRWAVDTEDVTRLTPHSEWVYDVSLSSDGRRLATTGPGPRGLQPPTAHLRVHDVETGEVALSVEVPGETVLWSAELAPDGARLVTAGSKTGAILWDAETGERLLELAHPLALRCATFDPSGARIATTCRDRVVRLWDSRTGELLRELRWGGRRPYAARFSPDGRRLAVGTYDGGLAVWDPSTGELVAARAEAQDGSIYALAFEPGGERLASGGEDGQVIEWEVAGLTPTGRGVASPASVIDLAFLPDGSRLFVGDHTGVLRVVATDTWSPVVNLRGHAGKVRAIAVDPAGRFVVSGGSDGDVRVWASGR